MKKIQPTNKQTKKGAASFYVVIFVTLVLSVITLSFVRVMLRESTNTTDSDLSQSALDAALAGIEDAKSALIRCNRSGDCGRLFGSRELTSQCNTIAHYLYGTDVLQEVQLAEQSGDASLESQAYTCVKLDNIVSDYRATLTSNMHIKVIPLTVQGGFGNADNIVLSWYSAHNRDESEGGGKYGVSYLQAYNGSADAQYFFDTRSEELNREGRGRELSVPPVLSAELIQANENFRFQDFIENSTNLGTNRSLAVLYPTQGAMGGTEIGATTMRNNGTDLVKHTPMAVQCNNENPEFACSVTMRLPSALREGNKSSEVAYLVVTTPYSNVDVDISVEVRRGEDVINFTGAQYKVDSTGRANDIYRRINTRVELGNINFPFPEYVAQVGLTGNAGGTTLNKNFWVTHDCQKTINEFREDQGEGKTYGAETCNPSGNL